MDKWTLTHFQKRFYDIPCPLHSVNYTSYEVLYVNTWPHESVCTLAFKTAPTSSTRYVVGTSQCVQTTRHIGILYGHRVIGKVVWRFLNGQFGRISRWGVGREEAFATKCQWTSYMRIGLEGYYCHHYQHIRSEYCYFDNFQDLSIYI